METQPDWLLRLELKVAAYAFVGLAFLVCGWFLTRRWRTSGAVSIGEGEGRTVSSPRIFVISSLCAALSLAVLILGLTDGIDDSIPDNRLWWMLIIAGFAIASAYAAVVASHRWEWNSHGLSWHGVWRSRQLSWIQVRSFGQDWAGNFFVTSEAAGTIRWSAYTHAYEALNEAVARYRPDLLARRV